MAAGVHEWHLKSGRYKTSRVSPIMKATPKPYSSPALRSVSVPNNRAHLSSASVLSQAQSSPSILVTQFSNIYPSRTSSPPPLSPITPSSSITPPSTLPRLSTPLTHSPLVNAISPDMEVTEQSTASSLAQCFAEVSKVITNYLSGKGIPDEICQWILQVRTSYTAHIC